MTTIRQAFPDPPVLSSAQLKAGELYDPVGDVMRCKSVAMAEDGGPLRCEKFVGHEGAHSARFGTAGDLVCEWDHDSEDPAANALRCRIGAPIVGHNETRPDQAFDDPAWIEAHGLRTPNDPECE